MKINIIAFIAITTSSVASAAESEQPKQYNILIAMADDMSYPYMSAYGAKCVSTPAFDEVAERGQLLNNGYVPSPGSSPSRAAILTGNHTWMLEEAGTHGSWFPGELVTYTDILKESGYLIGFTGKGWGPGKVEAPRKGNPAGVMYNQIKREVPYEGINTFDYFENFKAFMDDRKEGQPFCFWYGGKEAHRPYEVGSWEKDGRSLESAEVPGFLPDSEQVRGDLLDYAVETEWFDSQLGMMLRYLESIGELDNTLIVVTADNGMPFAAAKATCWDAGVHVPMAICLGDEIKRSKPTNEPVSALDFAATFLDLAGVNRAKYDHMESQSLLPWLRGESKEHPKTIYFARERHDDSRELLGYPIRALRKGDLLYIYNFEPDRFPAGDPNNMKTHDGIKCFIDVAWDDLAAEYIIYNKEKADVAPFFNKIISKRPQEELYDLRKDAACMYNVIDEKRYSKDAKELKAELFATLERTGDTRLTTPEVWDKYPYFL